MTGTDAGTPAASAVTPLVDVRAVTKTFSDGGGATVWAVRDITLSVPEGSVTAVTGPSGSGKSTLLHLIGALERPDRGTITVGDVEVTELRPAEAAAYRRRTGFVFQQFNLLPTLTALDNAAVPLFPVRSKLDKRARAHEVLSTVGLAAKADTLVTKLSGGQQQRVALARALVNHPALILADEPTGNLDSETGEGIVDLLLELREQRGTTIIIATHDLHLAARCDRTVRLTDGTLQA